MDIFDGIFDGDDLDALFGVDEIDHGGERGALAAAGGAGQEAQAAAREGDVAHDGWQVELVDGGDLRANEAQRDAEASHRGESAASESRDALGFV